MSKRFATLEDVAEAAGMSRAQVSRALRGEGGVKPATRERVTKVAESLGYRPNIAARTLVSTTSNSVGLFIGEPVNPFHMQLAQAIDRELTDAGLDSVVSLRALSDASALTEADRLLGYRVAGVILIGTPRKPEVITRIATRLPCVYLGKHLAQTNVSTIDIDDDGGTTQAVHHLIALGHRRIAHIGGTDEVSAKERTAAYRAAMEEAGLEPIVFSAGHDVNSGRRGIEYFMSQPTPPTALFASNDAIAIGAIDRLRGMGLRVPEDLSVVGFDDIPAASSETYSLSTIRQDTDEQARAAVQALHDLVFGEPRKVSQVVLPLSLVPRGSSIPLAR